MPKKYIWGHKFCCPSCFVEWVRRANLWGWNFVHLLFGWPKHLYCFLVRNFIPSMFIFYIHLLFLTACLCIRPNICNKFLILKNCIATIAYLYLYSVYFSNWVYQVWFQMHRILKMICLWFSDVIKVNNNSALPSTCTEEHG